CAATGAALLLQRGTHPGNLRRRRLEQRGGLRELRLERARRLRQQHRTAVQFSELLHLARRDRTAIHVAALDHELIVFLGEVAQNLRRIHRLTLDEGDRRGTEEEI